MAASAWTVIQPSQRTVTATASAISSRIFAPSRSFFWPVALSSTYPLIVSGLSWPTSFTPTANCLRRAHHRRDQHGNANGALDRPVVDCDHLERVAVQMDRMRHHRIVDHLYLDALPLAQHQRRRTRPIFAVHGPCIGLHSTAQRDRLD